MTDATWKTITAAITKIPKPPSWLRELAIMTYEEVIALPPLDSTSPSNFAKPHVTENLVKKDYLDFLREQIRLEPRGPEWTRILERRLNSLLPFLGKQVFVANFYHQKDSASLYVNPENGEVLNFEGD